MVFTWPNALTSRASESTRTGSREWRDAGSGCCSQRGLACAPVIGVATARADIGFGPPTDYRVGSINIALPEGPDLADFNGDGHLDIATANIPSRWHLVTAPAGLPQGQEVVAGHR